MERRDFLKRVVKIVFSLFVVVLLSALIYLYPSKIRKGKVQFIFLMDEDDLPRRGVKRVDFRYALEDRAVITRVYVVASDRGLKVLSPICTHLGCFVNWDNRKGEFICPCHAGRYSMNGEVIAGPPPRPLTALPLKILEGKVYLGIKV
jgi:cytochrome b6-f complex iron-sulfur subunit